MPDEYIKRSDAVFAFCGACEGTEICGQMGEPCDEVKRIMAIPAADVEPKQRWIPVTERLPDPTPLFGKNAVGAVIVQTCDIKAKHPYSRPLRYERRKVRGILVERWTYMDFTICHESITHWKPLSDPPKGEQNG